jgi:hypothetical protein
MITGHRNYKCVYDMSNIMVRLCSYPMSPGLCACCIIGFAFATPAGGGTERGPGGGADPGFGASRGVVSFVKVFHQYTRSLPSGSFTAVQGSASFCSACAGDPTREEPRLGAREKRRAITPPIRPTPLETISEQLLYIMEGEGSSRNPKREFCLTGPATMTALDKFLKSLPDIFL